MKEINEYLYEDMIKELSDSEVKQLFVKAVEQSRRITEKELDCVSFSLDKVALNKVVLIKNALKRELKRRKLIK